MNLTQGMIITHKLRESGKTPTDFARDFNVSPPHIYRIIHGASRWWGPRTFEIRKAIADQLHTTPENLWPRPKPKNNKKIKKGSNESLG